MLAQIYYKQFLKFVLTIYFANQNAMNTVIKFYKHDWDMLAVLECSFSTFGNNMVEKIWSWNIHLVILSFEPNLVHSANAFNMNILVRWQKWLYCILDSLL